MRMPKRWLAYGLAFLLSGCALSPAASGQLPYEAWRLGFLAPSNMEVWLETADVEDVRGHTFYGAMAGTVAINYSEDVSGWRQPVGWGAGRYLTGAALPKRIYVRWQSLVEPQTYYAMLHIPESARQLMRSKAPSMRAPIRYEYQKALAIGLAPGGWIKAWVMSPSSTPVEVLCQRADIEPKGANQGNYTGRYVTLGARSRAYLQHHNIPYNSWECPHVATVPAAVSHSN